MRSIALAAALAALTPALAAAQSPVEQHARELFERGRVAYERQLFTEAEDAFIAAYEAMPADNPRRSLILLNVAQAIERQGGRDDDALVAWQRFRDEAAAVADAEHLGRADERIRELSARAARRRAGAPEDAHEDTPEPVTPPPSEPSGFSPHPIGLVVAGVGGAAALAGVLVGAIGLAERGDILSQCEGTACPAELRDRAESLETYGIVADSLLWPGLGIAAVGVVLMFVLPQDQREAAVASCGARGCTLGWRF